MPKKKKKQIKVPNEIARQMILRTGGHSGPHKNQPKEEKRTLRKAKHKKKITGDDQNPPDRGYDLEELRNLCKNWSRLKKRC